MSTANHRSAPSPDEATTMQAVVFKGKLNVSVERRRIPQIQCPEDIVVKVRYTALCGSELHVFRGHQPSDTDFIMGHEFTGEVVDVGAKVMLVKKGDVISCRCEAGQLFGTADLDGGQAEFCRIPLAESTVVKVPPNIDEKKLVLMADIFPTGYFAARNAFEGSEREAIESSTVLVIGCGPVGLCAIINALQYNPKHLIAIDGIQDRLEQAKKLGAEAWNYKEDMEALKSRVKELTGGRGADMALELVGHSDALRMAFDLTRPCGAISSVGVHNGEIPWTAREAYNRNLRLKMGRCPVRSLFDEALVTFEKIQDKLEIMFDNIRPLSDAVGAYADFNEMKYQKIIFEADK